MEKAIRSAVTHPVDGAFLVVGGAQEAVFAPDDALFGIADSTTDRILIVILRVITSRLSFQLRGEIE